MFVSIKKILELVVNKYIEHYIINLDLSDATKNMLKRSLRKTFLDEDIIYDLENAKSEVEDERN